ncbi:MAG: hypothetical protein K2N29_03195, partial [Ruminiclostridium sp.]|nr:hypothetical protein [Ruminiclostridium sp.]
MRIALMRFLSVKQGDAFSKTYDLTAAKFKLGRITMGSGIPKGKVPFGGGSGAEPPRCIFLVYLFFFFDGLFSLNSLFF